MKKALALFAIVLTLGMSVALDADAKRLGGGKSSGMQRQATTAPATPPAGSNVPGQAAPVAGAAAAAAPAAAAAGKRSWMGPLAGLAAGLGLAALASHLGFGEGLANMMMIGLLVMAVLAAVAFVMRKRAANQGATLAGAGAASGSGQPFQRLQQQETFRAENGAPSNGGSLIGSRIGGGLGSPATGAAVGVIPAGFDTAAFAGNAKSQFLALQAANDARDLDRLRDFLTPDMFDLVRAEIAERGDAPQQTEVFGLDAQVLAVVEEDRRYVASVRFSGSVRDQRGAVPEDLDEIWHLTKPSTGSGGWMIAGIQQGADGSASH